MDTLHGPSPVASRTLEDIERKLATGETGAALEALRTSAAKDPWLANARAVCLMRAGYVRDAVEAFQKLVLVPDSLGLRIDLPTVFATNYATALLLEQNVEGCRVVLRELARDEHPTVQRLRAHVDRWRTALPFWDRMRFKMYGIVARPVPAFEPLGELRDPQPTPPRQAA